MSTTWIGMEGAGGRVRLTNLDTGVTIDCPPGAEAIKRGAVRLCHAGITLETFSWEGGVMGFAKACELHVVVPGQGVVDWATWPYAKVTAVDPEGPKFEASRPSLGLD